jgi:hypothetical protein
MGFFNFIITTCVGLVMLIGAGITYKYRMLEAEASGGPPVVIASPTQFVKNVAALHSSLPKWDDKNWKGLTYHEAGYYKKKADAAKQEASKQNAVR